MKVKKEIPAFLIEMSKQMREQDCRCTAHPFWQVRCKRYLVTKEGYNEHHRAVFGEDGEIYRDRDPISQLHRYLIENHEEWCEQWARDNHEEYEDWREAVEINFDMDSWDWPEQLKVLHMQEVEEVVWTGLTETGALGFIKRKQHDYPPLFTYVESAYWSPQLRELQDWIISLTADELCEVSE